MKEKDFVQELYQVLNRTRRIHIETLIIDDRTEIPDLLVELSSGEKFSISVKKLENIIFQLILILLLKFRTFVPKIP